MQIDEKAPATARAEAHIDALPAVVWQVMTDFERWPDWNPDVASVALDGPPAEGTVFRWRSGPGTITSTLRVLAPEREIAWTGRTFGIRAVHVWRLTPHDGGTRVVTEESWDGWIVRLISGPMGRTLAQSIERGLGYLKEEAERRAGTPGKER